MAILPFLGIPCHRYWIDDIMKISKRHFSMVFKHPCMICLEWWLSTTNSLTSIKLLCLHHGFYMVLLCFTKTCLSPYFSTTFLTTSELSSFPGLPGNTGARGEATNEFPGGGCPNHRCAPGGWEDIGRLMGSDSTYGYLWISMDTYGYKYILI